jgi:hypothetical protein
MAQLQSDLPIYSKLWNRFKQFPALLGKGSDQAPATNGPAAAALISGGIGAMTMMIIHHFCDTNSGFETWIKLTFGAWMPGAINPDPMWGNIGSYAGKETTLLLGWLISWPILHFLLKDKQLRPRTIFFWLLGLYTVAASMAYHPLFPYMPLT